MNKELISVQRLIDDLKYKIVELEHELKINKENSKNELSASEALFGFCGWLTTRKEITEMGGVNECSTIVDKISDFCKVNSLQEPRNGWQNKLMHPIEK